MWRWCLCALALVAAPVPGQTSARADSMNYSSDELRWHKQPHMRGQNRAARRHAGPVEPARIGPAPTGFWYRCETPAGYYPYVPRCQTPWRIVPSAPATPFR